MLASLHGCFQAVDKGTGLDSLVGEVLELIQDDLAMYNNETLHSSNLRHITYIEELSAVHIKETATNT